MNTTEVEEEMAPFIAMTHQCSSLNEAILRDDFDGFTRLDPTLNKAICYIHAADEVIARYPQGKFPKQMASLAVKESLRLLWRCTKRYGRDKTKRMSQAYHMHFRLWFCGTPHVPEHLYVKKLFNYEENLIAAICDHNAHIVEPTQANLPGDAKQTKSKRPRHKIRPRRTSWIRIEREAVLDFANDPKRNTSGKEPHELCNHVWYLNRAEFEKAASLPAKQRGYKNAASLRAYFYKSRHRYVKRKYAKTMSVSIDR